jgi:hypothetical protein
MASVGPCFTDRLFRGESGFQVGYADMETQVFEKTGKKPAHFSHAADNCYAGIGGPAWSVSGGAAKVRVIHACFFLFPRLILRQVPGIL